MALLNIGPVELIFDAVSLGLTHGGAVLTYTEATVPTTADVTGDTPRAIMVTGTDASVKAAITEATLAQLNAIAGGTLTTTQLDLTNRVGKNLVDDAATLIMKPVVEGVISVTETEWIYIPKCVLAPAFEVPNDLDEQKAWAFMATGLPVLAADIESGGFLYNSGAPEYAANDLVRLGYVA